MYVSTKHALAPLFFVGLFTALCGAAAAQKQDISALSKRIDALAEKALSGPVAGISVAVSRDNKPIFARGYGLANVEHSVAVTPETVFHICSISKNILSAVLLKLAEEGKLDLNDDITKYVPEAPVHGKRVTIKQLLNHTSGIYSFTSLPDAETNERLDLSHEQVLGLIKDRPFLFEPGSSWQYDNSAFYLAGMIVEHVTKQDYGSYVVENVFKPLGMNSASMCDARMVIPHLSSGYERDHGKLVNASFLSWKLPFAAGAVCATASDLLKWQTALDDGRVINPESLKLMRSQTTLMDGTAIDYGLGTRLGDLEGHPVTGHTGGGGGFGNALVNYPSDHLTIVILTNTGNGAGQALSLATAIARPMLGLAEKKTSKDLDVPKEELAALTGTYASDDGAVENFAMDGKLHFRTLPAGGEGVLIRQAKNDFAVDENVEVRFMVHNGHASWGFVYIGGLFMNAVRRVR